MNNDYHVGAHEMMAFSIQTSSCPLTSTGTVSHQLGSCMNILGSKLACGETETFVCIHV